MITLIFLILLPIVPAYLLFTTLPGKAAVAGPLKGFRINLSGAFAAYFSLVVLLLSTFSLWNPAPPPLKWTVVGQVVDAATSEPIPVIELRLTPPNQHTDGDGCFRMKFTTDLGDDAATMVYPRLVVIADGYKAGYVDLDPQSPLLAKRGAVSEGRQIIKIGQIALTKLPPYIDPIASLTSNSNSP